MTTRIKSLALIFSGIAIGCGAAATVGASWAGPQPGQWSCYQTSEAPDAELDEDATTLMNRIAKNVAAGTLYTFYDAAAEAPSVCVRE